MPAGLPSDLSSLRSGPAGPAGRLIFAPSAGQRRPALAQATGRLAGAPAKNRQARKRRDTRTVAGTSFEQDDWYRAAPLYYDIIFDAGTGQESTFIAGAIARYGRAGSKRLLEPACGSGRLVVGMAQAGFVVRGFDTSRPMLRYARARLHEHALHAQLVVGDMADFAVPKRVHLATWKARVICAA